MASTIRIKRSSTAGNPSTLAAGELAYSAFGGAGGNRLYIGMGTETTGNAANHLVIGGTYYTGLIDASTAGTLTTNASSIPVLSATGTIDKWLVGNLQLTGNTISSTNTNGNISLTPNGTGAVQISGAYTLPTTAGTSGYALITNGSSAASWQAISTTLNLSTDNAGSGSVNLLNQTLAVRGGNGIVTSISGQTLTISSIGAGGYTSTATGGTTTTLTASSSANQFFTGSTTQTIKLPDTSTLTIGQEYYITNQSTGALTIQTSASGALTTIPAGASAVFTVASTAAQTWVTEFDGATTVTGSGALVLANSPSLTSPSFGTIVNTGTLTLPTSTDTLVGRATTDTLTNKTINIQTGQGNTFQIQGNSISSYTGSGAVVVLSNTPTLVTPNIGVATATSVNKVTITAPATGSTLTIADGKTLTANNTLTFTGTDNSSVAFGGGGTVTYTSNKLSAFSSTTSAELAGVISDETGSGALVFANSPTLVTPVLGAATATSIVASNGFLSTNTYGGTYSDGIVVDYTTGTGRISVGSGDGITLYNNTDVTRQSIFAVGSTGAVSLLGGSITGTTAVTITAGGANSNINLVPTGTGTVDHNGARLTGVGNPTQSTDAANKAYVDSVKQALDIKDSVRVATTGNLNATASGSGAGKTLTNAGTQAAITIDSIVLVLGDRVLVKDQTTQANNGIYTVTTVGTASTNWVLTRAADADGSGQAGSEVTPGMFTFVEEGTVNADSGWVLSTDGAVTLDTTALTFVQFSGAGQIIAGAGLTKSGNQLDVVGTANRITVNADNIDIASTYVGQNSITTLGTITTGTWQAAVLGATYGGTGVNNGSNTITLGGNISTAGSFTTSGAFGVTLTATAATSVTLPTTGTLATLAGAETLTNKTISSSSASLTTLAASGAVTFTSTTDASALGTAAVVLSGGLSVAKAMYVGTNITGAGASTSTLDGFNIDGGTY